MLWSVFFFIQSKNWLSLPKWVKMNRLASILMLLLINMKYIYFSCTHFTCKKIIILFIYSNSISCLPTVSLLAEFFSTRARVLVAPYFVALLLFYFRVYIVFALFCCCICMRSCDWQPYGIQVCSMDSPLMHLSLAIECCVCVYGQKPLKEVKM